MKVRKIFNKQYIINKQIKNKNKVMKIGIIKNMFVLLISMLDFSSCSKIP